MSDGRNNELEKKIFAGGSDGNVAIERVHELEMQLRQLRARGGMRAALEHEGSAMTHAHKDAALSALEAQLVENAKGFAKQISELKILLEHWYCKYTSDQLLNAKINL